MPERVPYEEYTRRLVRTGELTPSCTNCEHFKGHRGSRCTAFPEGIPQAIQSGQVSHLEPVPEDGGVIYEPRRD